jgi:hypothetical protein
MPTVTIRRTWTVNGVLTDVTTALLSDPTGTYGLKRDDTGATVVADGTAMTKEATGTYTYEFTDLEDGVAYTAFVEFVYAGQTYHFEHDIEATTAVATTSLVATGWTRNILTFQDCYERAVNFLRANAHDVPTRTTGPPELLRGAIIDAYEHVLNAYDWPALEGVCRVPIRAERTTGTVTYTNSTRRAVITDGTFPTWCEGAAIRFNDETHQIQSYVNSTTVILDETLNPGEDVSDASYRLFRWWYELPRDFGSIIGISREDRGVPMKATFAQVHGLYRRDFATAWINRVAIGAHPSKPGRQVLAVYPASEEAESLDITYRRRPRDLRFAGYDVGDTQGTVTLTASSTAVTGSGTAFTDEMEEAFLRVGRTSARPTETHGTNRYAEQHPILSVTNATALVLAGAAAANRTGVGYVVTDPILIDQCAHNAVLRRIEMELASMFRSELLGTYRANADEALRYGMQGAAAMPPDLPGIPWRLGDGTTIVEDD